MMATVTALDGAGVEVLGVGALGLDELPPLPPHPHAVSANAATARTRNRMSLQ